MSRETFTPQGMNNYLDTPAGMALVGQLGGRREAAAAMAQAEAADRAWRRAQAEARFERYPERYESPTHAMADVPDPVGGGGAWLMGSSDEVVNTLRKADPSWRWRNLGYEDADTDTHAVAQAPGRPLALADTRPPWRRSADLAAMDELPGR